MERRGTEGGGRGREWKFGSQIALYKSHMNPPTHTPREVEAAIYMYNARSCTHHTQISGTGSQR